MNEAIEALRLELESEDLHARSIAAWKAGGFGADAVSMLPRLLEMLSQNPVLESTQNRCGEFLSIGRIIRSIDNLEKQGLATDEMVQNSDHCLTTIQSLLDTAAGARSSLLILTLAYSGPRAARTASDVSRVAIRSEDQRIKYRAYQFICAVCPELALTPPWSDFAPTDAEERSNWGRDPGR